MAVAGRRKAIPRPKSKLGMSSRAQKRGAAPGIGRATGGVNRAGLSHGREAGNEEAPARDGGARAGAAEAEIDEEGNRVTVIAIATVDGMRTIIAANEADQLIEVETVTEAPHGLQSAEGIAVTTNVVLLGIERVPVSESLRWLALLQQIRQLGRVLDMIEKSPPESLDGPTSRGALPRLKQRFRRTKPQKATS